MGWIGAWSLGLEWILGLESMEPHGLESQARKSTPLHSIRTLSGCRVFGNNTMAPGGCRLDTYSHRKWDGHTSTSLFRLPCLGRKPDNTYWWLVRRGGGCSTALDCPSEWQWIQRGGFYCLA